MKLIFDENLSPKLVKALGVAFPGRIYVREVGAPPISDRAVWDYARANSFAIVTKDSDYQQLAYLFGQPPKVIWLRCGNATTVQVESLLLSSVARISAFEADQESSVLLLS